MAGERIFLCRSCGARNRTANVDGGQLTCGRCQEPVFPVNVLLRPQKNHSVPQNPKGNYSLLLQSFFQEFVKQPSRFLNWISRLVTGISEGLVAIISLPFRLLKWIILLVSEIVQGLVEGVFILALQLGGIALFIGAIYFIIISVEGSGEPDPLSHLINKEQPRISPRQNAPVPKPRKRVAGRQFSATQIFQMASPSVYGLLSFRTKLHLDANRPHARGSAVAVGLYTAMTNCHVLANGGYFLLVKRLRKIPAVRFKTYKIEDRCILRAISPLNPFTLTRGLDSLKIGDKVYAIGSPFGLENTLSEGIISGKRKIKGQKFIQVDAAISPGSSGGGLFDEYGHLIGITSFTLKGAQKLNFAIPIYRHDVW